MTIKRNDDTNIVSKDKKGNLSENFWSKGRFKID